MTPVSAGLLLNFKDAKRTIRCVHSLLNQPVDWVVVWDNSGAGDNSLDEVRTCFANTPNVILLSEGRNLGFAAGVNKGLAYCREVLACDHVVIINNDATLLPGGLAKLGQGIVSHPAAQVAYPLINHSGKISGAIHYQRLTGLQFDTPRPGCFSFPSGCCLMVSLERARLPLLDEDFFMYGEDCALGWRLSSSPGATLFIPETLVDHEGSVSSVNGSEFYESRTAAAQLILTRKLARNRFEYALMATVRPLILLARACLRSCRSRSLMPLKGLWKGILIALGADPLRSPAS